MKWAFSDESRQRRQYCVVAVVIETHAVNEARKNIDAFRMPRQRRVHMVKERPARRQQFLDLLADLPIEVHAASVGTSGRTLSEARELALRGLVPVLLEREVGAWRLEGIVDHQQQRDRMAISAELRERGDVDAVVYDHYEPHAEPMLWAADGMAWAVLARRTSPTSLIEVP